MDTNTNELNREDGWDLYVALNFLNENPRKLKDREAVLNWLDGFRQKNQLQKFLPHLLLDACQKPIYGRHSGSKRDIEYGDSKSPEEGSCERSLMIVQVLLEHGADLTVRDKHGRTCLMLAATWNLELTRYLVLEKGLDVNATASKDFVRWGGLKLTTALHHAIVYNRFCADGELSDIVKFLCLNGANIRFENGSGFDSPKIIAVWCSSSEYFYDLARFDSTYTRRELADCFDLAGCKSVLSVVGGSSFYDMYKDEVHQRWRKAIDARNECQESAAPAYDGFMEGEYQTVQELDEVFLNPSLGKLMCQMIYKVERIVKLEAKGWKYFFDHKYARQFMTSDAFGQVLDLLITQPGLSLNSTYRLLKLFQFDNYYNHVKVPLEDELMILSKLAALTKDETRSLPPETIVLMTKMINGIVEKNKEEELGKAKKVVRTIGSKVLDAMIPVYLKSDHAIRGWKVKVTEFLLECGSDPDATDGDGDTALLFALSSSYVDSSVVGVLVKHGAHVDRRNREGKQGHKLLLEKCPNLSVDLVEKRSLQCLCASVIVEKGVPYRQLRLPEKFLKFIGIH